MRVHHWLWMMGVGFIIIGIYREEVLVILTNATMLCFSCIGLG